MINARIEYANGEASAEARLLYSPNADVPGLRKQVEWAEAQEALAPKDRSWDQETWAALKKIDPTPLYAASAFLPELHEATCGSSFCIAGNVVHQAGGKFLANPRIGFIEHAVLENEAGVPVVARVSQHAQNLLGLTHTAAEALFRPMNTESEIRALAEAIAGEKL